MTGFTDQSETGTARSRLVHEGCEMTDSNLCPRCVERGQTWSGGAPKCAFPNAGKFDPENWNCATANDLRILCGEEEEGSAEQAFFIRWDDESWGALNLIGVELQRDAYKTLWLSWYKHRGRTDRMYLLSDDGEPEAPDYNDCDAILKHYGRASSKEPR